MTTKKMRCSDCGGTLEVSDDKTVLFCPFCGSKELIDESDAVKIAQIQADLELEREKLEQEQWKRNNRSIFACYAILGGIFFIFLILGLIFGLE